MCDKHHLLVAGVGPKALNLLEGECGEIADCGSTHTLSKCCMNAEVDAWQMRLGSGNCFARSRHRPKSFDMLFLEGGFCGSQNYSYSWQACCGYCSGSMADVIDVKLFAVFV